MTDPNCFKQIQQFLNVATPRLLSLKQQLLSSMKKQSAEETRSNEARTPMSLNDQLCLFQKLANAEYLQRVAILRKKPNLELSGKRLHSKIMDQHESIHIDKDSIKRKKLDTIIEPIKVRQFLIDKELEELENISLKAEKYGEEKELLSHFKLLLRRNCQITGLIESKNKAVALRDIDMKLLKMILNKFKTHMYTLISNWLYEEYNLFLACNMPIYMRRYEDIIQEFCNLIEENSSDELVKSMENWYNFIWTLPYYTKRVFQNIYKMCIMDDPKNCIEPFYTIPFRLLKDLIMSSGHLEIVQEKALHRLLKLSTYIKNPIKLKAIKMISPELYSDPKLKNKIKDFALKSFEELKDFKGNEDETEINSQIGLALRLSAEDSEVLLGGIKRFPLAKDNAKVTIISQYKKLFSKCWKPDREELKDVFSQVELPSAVLVQTYVEAYKGVSFPSSLKEVLITLAKKISNYELLQPLIPQISQIEIDKNELIECAAISSCIGKVDFIYGLLQNIAKSTNYCEKFSQVLFILHNYDLTQSCNAVDVIDMCISKKDLFQLNEVVLPTLNKLANLPKVPIIIPRTLMKVSCVYPGKVIECLKIINILLERKAWEIPAISFGLKHYFKKFVSTVNENINVFSPQNAEWVRKSLSEE